jgi:hypothetical protein
MELAAFLVSEPTATAKLIAQHVDDGRGSCRVCTVGGQHGSLPWPCTIYTAARAAAQVLGLNPDPSRPTTPTRQS